MGIQVCCKQSSSCVILWLPPSLGTLVTGTIGKSSLELVFSSGLVSHETAHSSVNCWTFVCSSLGLTAVAFVTGALGMWVLLFLYRAQLVQGTVSPCLQETCHSSNR